MSTIKVDVSSSKKPVLQVGYQEENEVTDVLFDISAWVEEYGGGTAGLRVKRPQNSEEESYELSLPISENVATWTISRTDTFNKGNGKVQLKYYVGSALKRSALYTYKVGKSIVGSDNPVDPFDTWIERSKAWSIGELLDGEDVPASDETYHNNSKYYSEQVEGQAAEAKTQADLAKEYAHQFVGAPRAASTAGGMTDHDLIYVFTGTTTSSLTNGHWYYWNGSAWTDGGVYNSTAFTTDTTLSVSGAAADAKVVGDLKEDLNEIAGTSEIQFTDNYKIVLTGSPIDITPVSDTNMRCVNVPCVENDLFTISGTGAASAYLYAFLDTNNVILDYLISAGTKQTNYLVKAPKNAAKLIINNVKFSSVGSKSYYGICDISSNLSREIEDTREDISEKTGLYDCVINKNDGFYRLNVTTVDLANIGSGFYYHDSYDCSAGDTYVISGGSTGLAARMYAFIDSSNNVLSVAPANASYTEKTIVAPANSAKLLVNDYYGAASIKRVKLFSGAKLADVVYVNDVISSFASYCEIDNVKSLNGYISNSVFLGSQYSHAISFETEINTLYRVTATGDHNRMIVYGSTNGITFTEITRMNNPSTSETLTFNSSTYTTCYVQLHYNTSADGYNCDYTVLKATTANGFSNYSVGGVDVYTSSDIDERYNKRSNLVVQNIKLESSEPLADGTNLCLVCGKWINTLDIAPDYTGFLYFNDNTQKFYYSNGTPDNPQYLFDWDLSLANNEHCKYWSPTITKDGDIIFLRDHQRQNPIVYPHGNYNNPYVVDFGENKKPYGWLVSSSVVQFDDGSFVFGDYAYHSLTDEQNDDRRIIWRVEPPYNDPNNWTQAHSFKHVYFTSSQSDEPDNEIGHIHAIMYDFYADDLYCTTGDIDRHCRMWISNDHGETWAAVSGAVGTTANTTVQAEGQKWRMTNAVFTKEAIWWGTDAQKPYHNLWKCVRDENGHIDFTTLTKVADLESPALDNNYSQRTYINVLVRDPDGILLIDRGEPRPDKLDIKYYDFELNKIIKLRTFDRATTDASGLEANDRIGLPIECTTVYQPQELNYILTGGGKVVRPNNTSIFNNALDNYVGALKMHIG